MKFENTSYTPRGAKFIQYLTLLRDIHVYITVPSAANLKKKIKQIKLLCMYIFKVKIFGKTTLTVASRRFQTLFDSFSVLVYGSDRRYISSADKA